MIEKFFFYYCPKQNGKMVGKKTFIVHQQISEVEIYQDLITTFNL
jgi:hypothetical protein